MNSYATSLVRTWVPILVGSVVSWIASLGFHVGDETRRSLMVWMTGLLIGAYYTLVRTLERKYPTLGVLLGTSQQPSYTVPSAPSPITMVPPPEAAPAPVGTAASITLVESEVTKTPPPPTAS